MLQTVADMCNCELKVNKACRNCAGQRRTAAKKQIMTSLSLTRGTCGHYV